MTDRSASARPPRAPAPDHADPLERLLEIMRRLRDPHSGCPWDIEQTYATIAPHTIEEAYEVADAIERGDMAALEDELGDLLFQVVYHAEMASEEGLFDFRRVAARCADKLVRRHPHVFGDGRVDDAEAQTEAWEAIKARERAEKAARAAAERGFHSVLDDLTVTLPAMTRAFKLQSRASRVGFDWTEAADILGKIQEELDEVREEFEAAERHPERLRDEVGDLLFTVVNLARKAHIDPETALRHTNMKFERRFRRVESLLHEQGRQAEDSSLDEMEDLWRVAKTEERT